MDRSKLPGIVAGIALLAASTVSCRSSLVTARADVIQSSAGSSVRIAKSGGKYRLTVNGSPYFVKGAGGDASKPELKAFGGNSWRTWGSDTLGAQLDEAEMLHMTVTGGIWLGHKDNGFDYHNDAQLAAQETLVRDTVTRYKDRKSLLVWALGNEMETGQDGDPTVWKEIERLAAMVKKIDPNHPVMTVVAEIGGDKVKLEEQYCPDVDILGINSYGGCTSIPSRYLAAGGTKPYIITEFGPSGPWELPKNNWGAVPEPTSTEKAESYRNSYVKAILNNPLCLGSYAFTWGHKQEATATWFGMTLPDGSHVGAIDAVSQLWTGKPVPHPTPAIKSIQVVGPNIVAPGSLIHVALDASTPVVDTLKADWVVQFDPTAIHTGGAQESGSRSYPDSVKASDSHGADIVMPVGGGGYRIFAYVRNTHGGAATANVPVFVTGTQPSPKITGSAVRLPFSLYSKSGPGPYAPSGFMGNAADARVDQASTESPHSGPTSIKCAYYSPNGWAGVVWQSPANNWGDLPGGFNLTGAKTLKFWARGAQGGEKVAFSFGLLGRDKTYYDTGKGELSNVELTKEWKLYLIDLAGKDLSNIITGFAWVVNGSGKPTVFYIDDIRYE